MNQKDHSFTCKKHRKGDCKQCWNFKKDITKNTKDAEKTAKLRKKEAGASNIQA